MYWLETIRLLASEDKIKIVLANLSVIIGDLQDADGKVGITVHSREAFESDLLICLQWKRDGRPHKTREGLLLAESLTSFGMVCHELWKQALPESHASGRNASRSLPAPLRIDGDLSKEVSTSRQE